MPAFDLNLIIEWGGAPGGSRTPNPQIRSLMLYPLSYGRIRPSFSPIFSGLSTRSKFLIFIPMTARRHTGLDPVSSEKSILLHVCTDKNPLR